MIAGIRMSRAIFIAMTATDDRHVAHVVLDNESCGIDNDSCVC